MRCELCQKRRARPGKFICGTCGRFVRDYIDTGKIRRQTVPLATDVWLVMNELGVSQAKAVMLLGGIP